MPRKWSDKYRGAFDKGWDVMREETIARQKALGVVPADAELPPRNDAFPTWDSLDETHKRLYARQMEVYAGYSENADWNIGRIVDAIDEMGELENTVVIWIWGDNGASMEGTLTGTFNEMTTLNGIPLTPEEQIGLIFKHGGLEAWGDEQLAPHYSAGWAWAGNAPFDWGKQVASHLGGTRNPMVVHWPGGIGDAGAVRSHYTHVTDVGATILDLAGIPMPDAIDGVDAAAVRRRHLRRLALGRGRSGAPHAAVLRDPRQPGDVQGRLAAHPAAAADPVVARPGQAPQVRPGLGSR